MDVFTHGLLGATLVQCGFQKTLGRKAILWGALAAILPDIDVLVEVFAGPLAGFKYHRWITHSLWFGPLIGSGLGYLFWCLKGRRQSLSLWISLFILTLMSHSLLDLLTSSGIQLFAPFSDRRCSLDIISIIDLHFTGPLIFSVIMGFFLKKHQNFVQIISIVAFGISCTYLIYATNLHRQSIVQAQQAWKQQHSFDSYISLRSLPTLLQPYVRHLLIRYQDQNCVGTHRAPEFLKEVQWQCRTQLPNSCAKRLIDTPIGQRFAWFSDHNYVAEILNDNLIRFHDLRFTVPGQPFQGLWGLEGRCLPQLQLSYFRHKLTFSWQRLKMLNVYWKDKDHNEK